MRSVKRAHEAIAIAMNRLGSTSNSGEGGEDVDRFKPLPNGDSMNSEVKTDCIWSFWGNLQPTSIHAKELQIKCAQGAKPGEGGQLPGKKYILKLPRLVTPLQALSSYLHHRII